MTELERFLNRGPYHLMNIAGYDLWEHPVYGDNACVYMSTPDGKLVATGFYDLGDFDLELCKELGHMDCLLRIKYDHLLLVAEAKS